MPDNANLMKRSDLVCSKCQHDMGSCICPDCDARLKHAAKTFTQFAAKWCIACDRYWARCFCKEPKYRLYCAGVQVDPSGITTGEGRRLSDDHPDLGYDGPDARLL